MTPPNDTEDVPKIDYWDIVYSAVGHTLVSIWFVSGGASLVHSEFTNTPASGPLTGVFIWTAIILTAIGLCCTAAFLVAGSLWTAIFSIRVLCRVTRSVVYRMQRQER